MKLDSIPSSGQRSQMKMRNYRRESKHRADVEDQLVSLVFKPLLWCLWFLGLPVPELCTHNATPRRSKSACGTNGLRNRSVFSDDVEIDARVRQKSPKLLLNATDTTGDVTHSADVPVDVEREMNGFAISEEIPRHHQAITNARLDILRDKLQEETVKDVQLMTANQTSDKDGRTGIVNEREGIEREELPKDDAAKLDKISDRRKNVANRGTDKPAKYEPRKVDRTRKEREFQSGAEREICRPCRRKTVAGKIIFAFYVTLLFANAGRYSTIFFDVNALSVNVVAPITLMTFFLMALYIYVMSFYSLSKHMPKLIQLLQKYDNTYSVSFDCRSVCRNVIAAIILSLVFQAALAITVAVGFHTFLPSFRRHLSPWQDLEGVDLYGASVASGLVLCSTINVVSALSLWLHTSTHLLRKEFDSVAQQFGLLFGSSEDSFIANAGKKTVTLSKNNCSSREAPKRRLSSSTVFCRRKVTPELLRSPKTSMMNVEGNKENDEVSQTIDPKFTPGLKPQRLSHANAGDAMPVYDVQRGHGSASRHTQARAERSQHFTHTYDEDESGVSTHGSRSPMHIQVRVEQSQHFTKTYDEGESGMSTHTSRSPRHPQAHVEQPQHLTQTYDEGESGVSTHSRLSSRHLQTHTEPWSQGYEERLKDLEGAFDCFHVHQQSEGTTAGTDEEPLQDLEDALVKCHSTQQQSEEWQQQGYEDDRPEDIEDAFDRLHTQHQILCVILKRSQGCLAHLVSAIYIR